MSMVLTEKAAAAVAIIEGLEWDELVELKLVLKANDPDYPRCNSLASWITPTIITAINALDESGVNSLASQIDQAGTDQPASVLQLKLQFSLEDSILSLQNDAVKLKSFRKAIQTNNNGEKVRWLLSGHKYPKITEEHNHS